VIQRQNTIIKLIKQLMRDLVRLSRDCINSVPAEKIVGCIHSSKEHSYSKTHLVNM